MSDTIGPVRSGSILTPQEFFEPVQPQPQVETTPLVQLNQDTFETRSVDLRQQLTSPNSRLAIAIGNAEGTRTLRGGFTNAYYGHGDPGNRRWNKGTFSFQVYQNRNVRTPGQADQAQLSILRARIPQFEAAARRAGLDPSNPRLQAAFFDLSNQSSPRIWGRFLARLTQTLGGKELSVKNIIAARYDAMFDDRGRFTATGLKRPSKAMRDQTRRTNAIEQVLQSRMR